MARVQSDLFGGFLFNFGLEKATICGFTVMWIDMKGWSQVFDDLEHVNKEKDGHTTFAYWGVME